MNFITNTQEELKTYALENGQKQSIEYLNRDYFNGDENIEKTEATVIIDENGNISFLIQDDYGMDKFIKEAKVLK